MVAKTWGVSYVRYIILLKEISGQMVKVKKTIFNCSNPPSLGQHSIKNRLDGVVEITAWMQEVSLSLAQMVAGSRSTAAFSGPKQIRWTEAKWKSVLWSDRSKPKNLLGNYGYCILLVKEENVLSAYSSVDQAHLDICDFLYCYWTVLMMYCPAGGGCCQRGVLYQLKNLSYFSK